MIGAVAIVAGYLSLIVMFGWVGVAAAALHGAVLLLGLHRRK